MMNAADRAEGERVIVAVLPACVQDLARLRLLADVERLPVVTVVGKYNHGKSRLLNELMGVPAFTVADKRETVALAERDHAGVRWLDAPGLDADVDTGDDAHALRAAWQESDIRLFVHAITAGELDASERGLLASLLADAKRTQRQTLVVLSQVDQVHDAAQAAHIRQTIAAQLPAIAMHAVSATRHRQGVDKGSALMQTRSGLLELRRALAQATDRVPHARMHEAALLKSEMRAALHRIERDRAGRAADLDREYASRRERFDDDLAVVLDKVATDIQAVLEVPGPDHSLTPDLFADQFKLTPGKLERNRLQLGYSKACIAINAVLIRHGVTELPAAQQTAVRSLDSVMVAVMGVYVKYRKDLQRIFCGSAGREQLRREFTRYFELSADRVELAATIARADNELRAATSAVAACERLSPRATVAA